MLRSHLEKYQRLRRAHIISTLADGLLIEGLNLDRRKEKLEQLRASLEAARANLELEAARTIGCVGLGNLPRLRHIDVTDQPDCRSPFENLG